jgi:hypothetical protein
MYFSLWGHLKEHVCAVLPRTIEGLMARLQTVVTTVNANMLTGVKRECYMAHYCLALQWMEANSNTYCNYEVPMV